MYGIVGILVLCISSFILVDGQHDNHNHKVNVTVYYESMCSDSIKFITEQLHPALQMPELEKHINLTLIPYGKSKTMGSGHDITFECHHGNKECEGNKIHACSLKLGQPGGGVIVNFVDCLLKAVPKNRGDWEKFEFPIKTCAENHHIQNMKDIENCAGSTTGSMYLAEYGNVTNDLQNPLKSVPTVVFNNKLDATESSNAQTNFQKALCGHISHDKPEACKNSGNLAVNLPATSFFVSLVMLLVTFTVF